MPNSAHFFMLLKQHNHNQSKNRYQQTSGLLVSRRLEYSLAVTGNKFKTKLLLSRIIYYLPEEIQNRTILQNINIHITCYRVSKLFKHELAYLMVVTKSLNSPPLVYVVTSLISVHPTLHIKLRYHHDTATLGREGGGFFSHISDIQTRLGYFSIHMEFPGDLGYAATSAWMTKINPVMKSRKVEAYHFLQKESRLVPLFDVSA